MSELLKIFNGRIITPDRVINQGTIIVKDGKIIEVADKNIEVSGAKEIDARGQYITPGFIDIHVHGGGGFDFMDGTVEAFLYRRQPILTLLYSGRKKVLHNGSASWGSVTKAPAYWHL